MAEIDNNSAIINGETYTYNFTFSGVGDFGSITEADIQAAIAGDSNFSSPVAAYTKRGILSSSVQVSFVYMGQGSSVGENALEMQQVLNNANFFSSWTFVSATQGVQSPATAPPDDSTSSWIKWTVIGIVAVAVIAVAFDVHSLEDLFQKG